MTLIEAKRLMDFHKAEWERGGSFKDYIKSRHNYLVALRATERTKRIIREGLNERKIN